MSWDSLPLLFVAALLVWLLVSFVREKWSADVVAAIAVAALLVTQILTPHEVLSVLSNSAPATIACMFVLSAALERTGCIDALKSSAPTPLFSSARAKSRRDLTRSR